MCRKTGGEPKTKTEPKKTKMPFLRQHDGGDPNLSPADRARLNLIGNCKLEDRSFLRLAGVTDDFVGQTDPRRPRRSILHFINKAREPLLILGFAAAASQLVAPEKTLSAAFLATAAGLAARNLRKANQGPKIFIADATLFHHGVLWALPIKNPNAPASTLKAYARPLIYSFVGMALLTLPAQKMIRAGVEDVKAVLPPLPDLRSRIPSLPCMTDRFFNTQGATSPTGPCAPLLNEETRTRDERLADKDSRGSGPSPQTGNFDPARANFQPAPPPQVYWPR